MWRRLSTTSCANSDGRSSRCIELQITGAGHTILITVTEVGYLAKTAATAETRLTADARRRKRAAAPSCDAIVCYFLHSV